MSIIDKLKTKSTPEPDFSLTKSDIEFLLVIIKDASFKGESVEQLYNIVYKLQQQYLKQ